MTASALTLKGTGAHAGQPAESYATAILIIALMYCATPDEFGRFRRWCLDHAGGIDDGPESAAAMTRESLAAFGQALLDGHDQTCPGAAPELAPDVNRLGSAARDAEGKGGLPRPDSTTPACPPSEVCDQIIAWDEVQEGDLVLYPDDLWPVEWIAPYAAAAAGVTFIVFKLRGLDDVFFRPCGALTAVRRYVTTEG